MKYNVLVSIDIEAESKVQAEGMLTAMLNTAATITKELKDSYIVDGPTAVTE